MSFCLEKKLGSFSTIFLLILAFHSPMVSAADSFSGLTHEVNEYCKAPAISIEKEKDLAQRLIKLAYNLDAKELDKSAEHKVEAGCIALAERMREKIKQEFPEVNSSKGESVGAKLFFVMKQRQNGLDVLIRESRLMSQGATLVLDRLYVNNFEDHNQYNPKILEFFKETANLGYPESQLYLGSYYLEAKGVPINEREGINYLLKSNLGESYLVLARYYLDKNDRDKAEQYWQKAAERNKPQGYYNLGISAQYKKSYEESVRYFKKAIELDPEYLEASLELARMYSEGWGVPRDQKRGFEMMKMVAEKSEDDGLQALANANLGIFHFYGMGTPVSKSKGREYLRKAADAGCNEAKDFLLNN